MAATLDVISEGRLNFGIGAGWYRPEYEAYGIPFPNASARISQLVEAIQLIKTCGRNQLRTSLENSTLYTIPFATLSLFKNLTPYLDWCDDWSAKDDPCYWAICEWLDNF
jgi:alkanesulfonate monooxygenase SsuD/methylene tetrahydromethanopterin reductase-like flavin-dependent oxidoreductase (luciferase family)